MRSVALERETRTPRVATRDATVRAGQKVPHGRPSDAVGPARRAGVAPGGLRELRGDCLSRRRSGSALGMNHTGTAAQPRRVGTARCRGSTSIAGDGLSRPSWQTTILAHAARIPLPVVTHLSTQREQARHGASCGAQGCPATRIPRTMLARSIVAASSCSGHAEREQARRGALPYRTAKLVAVLAVRPSLRRKPAPKTAARSPTPRKPVWTGYFQPTDRVYPSSSGGRSRR